MLFPLTAATGVTQLRISLPSKSTEQAPHCARPQPKRGPCRWSSLCRTYSRGVSRLAVTLCTRPLTLILSLLATYSSIRLETCCGQAGRTRKDETLLLELAALSVSRKEVAMARKIRAFRGNL